tara:strand:+ start:32 stop:556 length:525 start_codon:yes stop_codon:yes gene_type:complete
MQLSIFDAKPFGGVVSGGEGRKLAEARAEVEAGRAEGIECPCCEQFCRIYRRKLNNEMARWLIWLVRQGSGWVDVKKSNVRGGDYGKLIHWQLVEQKRNADTAKRTSGLWRHTQAGADFAHGRSRVPSHVFIYNNAPVGFSDLTIDIREALGRGFDYADLMRVAEYPDRQHLQT